MLADHLDLTEPLISTIEQILSAEECEALIARIEALGFAAAPITTGAGFVMRPDIRNNTRVMLDDPALAALLFERARYRIPESMRGMRAVGANERLRCYRYEPGQRFASHYDGAFVRDDHEESRLTFMVYLNEGFTGGATRFHDLDRVIVPRTGMALLFQHALLHEGCVVEKGVKYAVRSDVMYRRA